MKTQPSNQSAKARLRSELRRKRAAIGASKRAEFDRSINAHVLDYARRKRPDVVAAYLAFDGEPDLRPALKELEAAGTTLALPVILDDPGRAVITFRQWARGSTLEHNRYGIAEPVGTVEIPLLDVDLALIPLVGWDRTGGRLGMGASFYDRLFQPLAAEERPLRMGVGYDLQRLDKLPMEPWDIRLHMIVSESGWFTCGD